MARSATLKDVADAAGVSTATVARVLHGNGYVAEETRARVERALKATGYRLNVVARGLRTQRSFMLGHLLHAITENPFFAQVALGVEQEALRHGYHVLLYNLQGRAERERAGVEALIERRVDAIVFTTAMRAEHVALATDAGIPVVQVERVTPARSHAVVVDNYVGAREAMAHLLELGHRRIGYIGGDPACYPYASSRERSVEEQRLAAYRDALAEGGAALDERLVRLGRYYSLENGGGGEGRTRMAELLSLEPRPTAVFATCDVLAAGALQAIYEAGLRVPDDLSLVGFDDTVATQLAPPLTTVALPMREIGRAAARLALEADGEAGGEGTRIEELRSTLRVRASTGPPRAA